MDFVAYAKLCDRVYDTPDINDYGDRILSEVIDGRLCLAIAGTHSFNDVMTDIEAIPTFKGWDLGFWNMYLRIAEPLDVLRKGEDALIMGHSLGGTAGQMYAAYRNLDCVSFGAPKPYFCVHQDIKPRSHIRIVHRQDPVPLVPPAPIWETWETKLIEVGEPGVPDVGHHKLLSYIKEMENYNG